MGILIYLDNPPAITSHTYHLIEKTTNNKHGIKAFLFGKKQKGGENETNYKNRLCSIFGIGVVSY